MLVAAVCLLTTVRYALLKGVYFKTNEAFIFLNVLLKKQGYLRPCEYKAGQKKVLRHAFALVLPMRSRVMACVLCRNNCRTKMAVLGCV